MRHSKLALRGALFFPYLVLTAVVLFLFSANDPFCARAGGPNHKIVTLELALALSVVDLALGVIVASAVSASRTIVTWRWTTPVTAALLVGAVYAYFPNWIYSGHGHFRFENTWADASCFATEGNLFGFMFFVAPILALATFLREAVILYFQTRHVTSPA
jgi:hypothetical protein